MSQSSTPAKPKRVGRWDESLVRFEHFMCEFSKVASNVDSRYDPVYASLFTIRDLLRRRALRESEMVR